MNVSQLDVAWTATLAGSLSTVPLIVGDTIFVQDGAGEIAALDRANGKERWKTEAYGSMIGPYGVAVGNHDEYGCTTDFNCDIHQHI